MNILFLCKKIPFESTDGESIVILKDAESLNVLGHKIFYACVNTKKHKVEMHQSQEFIYKTIDTNHPKTLLKAATHSNIPIQIGRFFDEGFLQDILNFIDINQIDYIYCQGLAMCVYGQYLFKESKIPIAYRAHNLEYRIWSSLSIQTKHIAKKLFYNFMGNSLRNYESHHLDFLSKIISINKDELSFFKAHYPSIKSKSIAITLGKAKPVYNPNAEGILFVGSLDWEPNLEGLQWFFDKVYPLLDTIPITVAGKGAKKKISSRENVRTKSNFDSIDELMKTHRLMIVPLFSGGGIRIKLIQSMQYGMPAVSTPLGAEDIMYRNQCIVLADDAQSFALSIKKMYDTPSLLLHNSEEMIASYNDYYCEDMILDAWKQSLAMVATRPLGQSLSQQL